MISDGELRQLTRRSLRPAPTWSAAGRASTRLSGHQNGPPAVVMENRTLCSPTSTGPIPTINQEDHVSQATWTARKARMVVDNVFKIVGIECLCACQAISLAEPRMGGLALGGATARAYRRFRAEVPMVKEDRYMYPLVRDAIRLVRSGELLAAVGLASLA